MAFDDFFRQVHILPDRSFIWNLYLVRRIWSLRPCTDHAEQSILLHRELPEDRVQRESQVSLQKPRGPKWN